MGKITNYLLCCYVAARHLASGQNLSQNVRWRMRTSPETISPPDRTTNQPVADFEMPMAFHQIPRFENLDKVKIKIFRYQGKDLIQLRI